MSFGQVFKGLENGHGSFLVPGSCIRVRCVFLCKFASRHLALRVLLSHLQLPLAHLLSATHAGTIREAGYWRMLVPARGHPRVDAGRRPVLDDLAGLGDSGTVAIISNTGVGRYLCRIML